MKTESVLLLTSFFAMGVGAIVNDPIVDLLAVGQFVAVLFYLD